jgi:hypothetical protein
MVRVSTLASSPFKRGQGSEVCRGKALETALVKETPRVKEAQQWDGLRAK